MPRPRIPKFPDENLRHAQINIPVSEAEKDVLREAAKKHGASLAAWLREVGLQAALGHATVRG